MSKNKCNFISLGNSLPITKYKKIVHLICNRNCLDYSRYLTEAINSQFKMLLNTYAYLNALTLLKKKP